MTVQRMTRAAETPTLATIAEWAGTTAPAGADLSRTISGVAPLDRAQPGTLTFFDNPRYAADLKGTLAAAVLLQPRHVGLAPPGCVALATSEPYRAIAEVLRRLYPSAARPGSAFGETGISPGASVHPSARLEAGVVVDPGAVICPGAEIGSGAVIGANAAIGSSFILAFILARTVSASP